MIIFPRTNIKETLMREGSTWLVEKNPSLRMATNRFIHGVVSVFFGEDEIFY
jgi:hypothetical protein